MQTRVASTICVTTSHTVPFASLEGRCAMFYQCGDTHWSSVMTIQFHLLVCAATSRLWIPHRMRSVCGVCNSGHRCRRWGPRHCTRSSFATPLQPPASPAHCTACPQGHTARMPRGRPRHNAHGTAVHPSNIPQIGGFIKSIDIRKS